MPQCARCGAETQLYESGIPICVECSDAREIERKPPAQEQSIHGTLYRAVIAATARVNAAADAFSLAVQDVPSSLPHPDGSQRIGNASQELSIARKEMMQAYGRFNDFLNHGIVPEDLKRTG